MVGHLSSDRMRGEGVAMAYQAKRRKRFIENFELADENGEVVETLRVSLDADDMVARLSRSIPL